MTPRDSFDAALVPGMRDRLAEAYRVFRAHEAEEIGEMAPTSAAAGDLYRVRECPLCGASHTDAGAVLKAHGLTLLKCRGCGLAYTREVMDEAADAHRYVVSKLDAARTHLRLSPPYLELEHARARYYLAEIARCSSPPGALLEIGCGYGTMLLEAERAGWRALGVEPGSAAASAARDRGAAVRQGYFPADLPDEPAKFDVIVALDVLEHMAHPLHLLSCMKGRLAEGGLLLIQAPNWDSLLVQLEGATSSVVCPGHWSQFTPSTLQLLLEKAGFRTRHIGTVQSEIDRIDAFPAAAIERQADLLRPGARPTLDAEGLHDLLLGYKLFGLFDLAQAAACSSLPQAVRG